MKTTDKKSRPNWRPFEEARAFVHTLNLKNRDEWTAWTKTKARPIDIPIAPSAVYKNEGWAGWGDWLGTGRVASRNIVYRPFNEARLFSRALGLKNQDEWRKWARSAVCPSDLPIRPDSVYKNKGWKNWGDWLGTKNKKGGFRSFEEARNLARNLGFKNSTEWSDWVNSEERPDDIPMNPVSVYKNKGWISWGDWLDTGYIASQNRKYREFGEARKYVRTLNLKSGTDWRKWIKSGQCPDDIPANPDNTYKNKGWISWGDWLGTGLIAAKYKVKLPFEEARAFVRSLELKSYASWKEWGQSGKCPENIPAHPETTYKNKGWVSWHDWLGTGRLSNQNRVFRPFEEARLYARSLELKNSKEWSSWAKSQARPSDIPFNPATVYAQIGWQNLADWLGTRNKKGGYLSFEESRTFARSLDLLSKNAWIKWSKSDQRPLHIPSKPDRVSDYLTE